MLGRHPSMRPTPGQRCAKRSATVAVASRRIATNSQRCRTSPRCCRAQPNRLTVFVLLIKVQMSNVLQICPTLKNMHHHASHNPQTNKKDQRSKTYLAEISKLSTKVHGASCRICGILRNLHPSKKTQKPCGYHLAVGVVQSHGHNKL